MEETKVQTKETKTLQEWSTYYETILLDFSGFPKGTTLESKFTKEEFMENCTTCTLLMSDKIMAEWFSVDKNKN